MFFNMNKNNLQGRLDGKARWSAQRKIRFQNPDLVVWLAILGSLLLVAPPFFFLIKGSLTVPLPAFRFEFGLENYRRVLALDDFGLWRTTLAFALGSSCVAIGLGVTCAWLIARTDVPFRGLVQAVAFLSLATPFIVKGIGWILLLGPNNGLINQWFTTWFGFEEPVIELFSLGGMIFVEGLLWTPIAFLLALPPLSSMDPALEEAAMMSGASRMQSLLRIMAPMAMPSILAILLLSFVRALESFEVPLLIGVPGGEATVTTALYRSIRTGLVPRYGEASAYAVLLVIAIIPPLILYYRATRAAGKFATITGRGFRPGRIALRRWRWPCALFVLLVPVSLVAPLSIMLWASFTPTYVGASMADVGRMSLGNYAAIMARDDVLNALGNSLFVGACSAACVALGSFALSMIVVRSRASARFAIDAICSAPLVFPGIVLGFAILQQFLYLRSIPIYGTDWVLTIVFIVKFMPYGMRFSHTSLLSLSKELEESGHMSGASAFTVLRRIALPLAAPAVAATAIYVFMNSMRDLSSVVLLSGPRNNVIPMVILDLWNNGEIPRLAALSVLVAGGVSGIGVVFMRFVDRYGLRA
jgi:iron(III) transport system permease protein